jgi:hypothetical protein
MTDLTFIRRNPYRFAKTGGQLLPQFHIESAFSSKSDSTGVKCKTAVPNCANLSLLVPPNRPPFP